MIVHYNQRAYNAMRKAARWVEDVNTSEAGERWFIKLRKEIEHLAEIKAQYAICKNPSLARYKYRCFAHKDKWVVAYKLEPEQFVVYRFIFGPWLDY